MKNLCFYFEIHQPMRLKRYRFFDIEQDHYYYDDFQNEERIRMLAEQSFLPANRTLLEIIQNSNGKFRCAFSFSGIVLEQLEQYAPEVIDSFEELSKTGCVEFMAETYAHSLSSVYDIHEFEQQVALQTEKIESLFGKKPTVFRNSELIYSDEIGEKIYNMGYRTILIDEVSHVLGWKSPNFVYRHPTLPKLKLLVRNFKLSDDIAFHFSDRSWSDYPLTADKFISWIKNMPDDQPVVNIWLGYEALGLFQRPESGIFEFLKAIPFFALQNNIGFLMPSEVAKKIEAVDILSSPEPISWSGIEKDISLWNGNDLQQEALNKLYAVGERVRLCSDRPLRHDWLMLQSSDHFRYMSHKDAFGTYYESPYDAFMNYMNILADFLLRVDEQYPTTIDNEELNALLNTIYELEKEVESLENELKKLRSRKKTES
jgi:alpha-amylase